MSSQSNDRAVRGSGTAGDSSARPSPAPPVLATGPLFIDMGSSAPLPNVELLPVVAAAADGRMWLDGDALMCACPDCQAPMSIRLWLMLAQCWRCGTTIELTQEQEREALRLLQEREQAQRRMQAGTAPASTSTDPRLRSPAPHTSPAASSGTQSPVAPRTTPDKQNPRPAPATSPLSSTVAPARQRVTAPSEERRRAPLAPPAALTAELSVIGTTGVWLRGLFRDMPALIISLLFHLVLIILIGIFKYGGEMDRSIVLSSSLSTERREGEGEFKFSADPTFDLPIPDQIDQRDPVQRALLMKADQDAREIRIDPLSQNRQFADLDRVKAAIGRGGAANTPLIGRDPRVRVEMIAKEGGTTMTEAAVSRGLRWLALNQHKDGRWRLHDLPYANGGQANMESDTAATSLALLPFLGAGQTHLVGKYQDTVAPGLRWLIAQQRKDGDLRGVSQGNAGMYAHGQSAIVLCEAFGMTRDESLKEPAQKAIDFIVAAQHPAGGWRYQPGEAGDTSVVGWQLMALQSARAAGLRVPDSALENASHYLDTICNNEQSRYAYQRGREYTNVMTAEALLCRIYLGMKKEDPGFSDGVDWLVRDHLPGDSRPDFYYWYYGTQTLHHYGGPQWEKWNLAMRDVLVSTQERSGRNAGSWGMLNGDNHARQGGRIYTTALAVCTLEIYDRHLPVFRQLELESPPPRK